MKLETKYNLGDRVKWPEAERSYTISDIRVIVDEDGVAVQYDFGGHAGYIAEEHLTPVTTNREKFREVFGNVTDVVLFKIVGKPWESNGWTFGKWWDEPYEGEER